MQRFTNLKDSIVTNFKILDIDDLSGYPPYLCREDIFFRACKVIDIDFEEITENNNSFTWDNENFEND